MKFLLSSMATRSAALFRLEVIREALTRIELCSLSLPVRAHFATCPALVLRISQPGPSHQGKFSCAEHTVVLHRVAARTARRYARSFDTAGKRHTIPR